ncbi:MAG: class 1 isoprenoid biosynthesis enzyme [Pseudomonadota bacterium]
MVLSDDIDLLFNDPKSVNIFKTLTEDLFSALSQYWNIADGVIRGSGISLKNPSKDFYSLERNFFSLLFIYSYHKANIPADRRIFYAAINHCIRGMVTGCDNILDDEYKKTLDTSLPEKSYRFRSVIDIMVSDRVLFELLCKQHLSGKLAFENIIISAHETLKALIKSGVQEASEEAGVKEFLKPEIILSKVHHYKTGVLFQCPWAVPALLESIDSGKKQKLLNALYNIGMGCQIMDDMVDLKRDIRMKRNNYIASLIYHEPDERNREAFRTMLMDKASHGTADDKDLILNFPDAQKKASCLSFDYLDKGFGDLFEKDHSGMKNLAISFIARQIGAAPFLVKES